MSDTCSSISVEPILQWLEREVLPRYESELALCRKLSARTGIQPKSWARFFLRLRQRARVDLYAVDRLCTALGEHLSRFDTAYSEVSL